MKNQKPLIIHLLDWLETTKEFVPDKKNGIFYPTKEQIISLHDYLITKFQWEGEPNVHPGLQNDGPLDFTGIKYYEEKIDNKWDDLIYRGAKIFNLFLEEGHPFVDGNKRTGFVTLWIFLIINNFRIRFDYLNYQVNYDKIKKWADLNSDDNIYEISEWIKDNETLYQKIRRYILNISTKIIKLIK